MSQEAFGRYIRESVIPMGMSVSEAARKLEIARPTLSNLLNGKSTLSASMATKFQRVFKADKEDLIRRQARLSSGESTTHQAKLDAKRRAAGYLDITSSEVEAHFNKPKNRTSLPTLLRRLVFETANDLTQIDFPGEDDGERPGWDGTTFANGSSAWVPKDRTCWEISCSADLPGKPDRDIDKRAKQLSPSERKETTFIFVTSQRWSGKGKWEASKRAKSQWRDVRVVDGDLLSQWLEQSASAQIWLSEHMGKTAGGEQSLEQCWIDWAEATDPPFSESFFDDHINGHRERLIGWLSQPANKPFVVVGDSKEEVLAFLARALDLEALDTGKFGAGSVVVSSEASMRKAGAAMFNGVIVVTDPAAERVCGSYAKFNHVIIVRPRNSLDNDPNIALGPVESGTLKNGLIAMGKSEDEIDRYDIESGRSLTILRRRLSHIPEIQTPLWAREKNNLVGKLIPVLLAGSWNKANADDITILELLSNLDYRDIEKNLAELLGENDPAVWSLGSYRGVVSRKDALFTVSTSITDDDIQCFLDVAKLVLSEDDPTLELERSERWSAGMFGKTRKISGALREAIGEMLILLAVYSDQLFASRIRPVPPRIDNLVATLLSGEPKAWMNQRYDLRKLAEASPDAFLKAVERDLESDEPQILEMLRPVTSAIFDSPDRTDLLWALEILAWDASYYQRVGLILAHMSQIPIEDNWMNKPINSLGSLVRFWWPQTNADIEKRKSFLDLIVKKYPDTGWDLCFNQIDTRLQSASANAQPRWRELGASETRRPSGNEEFEMRRKAVDLVLAFSPLTAEKLGQMLDNIRILSEEDQQKVWNRAEEWLADQPSDDEKSKLKEKIRRSMRLHAPRDSEKEEDQIDLRLKLVDFLARLEPSNIIAKHKWLFAENWVQESWDEINDEKLNYEERRRRIEEKRTVAAGEVFATLGIDGIGQMLEVSGAQWALGFHLAKAVDADRHSVSVAQNFVSRLDSSSHAECLRGFASGLSDSERLQLSNHFAQHHASDHMKLIQLFPCAPHTWDIVESKDDEFQDAYWQEASPLYMQFEPLELNHMLKKFLKAGRPFTALRAAELDIEKVDVHLLGDILIALPTSTEPSENFQLRGYELARALKTLDESEALSAPELARLEYLFFQILKDTDYGTPNLEKQISENPAEFVTLVCLMFNRDDNGTDPPEYQLPDDVKNKQEIGSNVFRVLEEITRIPGMRDDGSIDPDALIAWVIAARQQLKKLARLDVGDGRIGTILSKSQVGEDGIWPHPAIRIALEEVGTARMSTGMEIGEYNNRGTHTRGPNGDQERDLAAKYRNWSRALETDYPFTAQMLENIASSYDRDAEWHDTDEAVRRRLGR